MFSEYQKKYSGGFYGGLKGQVKSTRIQDGSIEIHHMPANKSYPTEIEKIGKPELGDYGREFNPNSGPAIMMDYDDHLRTASHTQTAGSLEYRKKQMELIRQGKFEEAMQMDIDNIRALFGNKYDYAINQALEHTKWLREHGYLNIL
jgi:hypothetical protein